MSPSLWIVEAAFRSLLMAVAVWAGIRVARVRAVGAQKLAWALVLLAAGTMPLAMRSPWLANGVPGLRPVRLPLGPVREPVPSVSEVPANDVQTGVRAGIRAGLSWPNSDPVADFAGPAALPKPSPAHRVEEESATPVVLPNFDVATTTAPLAHSTALRQQASLTQPVHELVHDPFWTWSRTRLLGIGLYSAVAGALLLRILLGLSIALRIWRRAEPLAGNSGAPIRVSRDLATPVTIGSTVILPASSTDWEPAKLRIVLAHEQAHIRQRDFYLQVLAALHAAAFWFSPLGWWLQRKLSELGEALSDRAGLAESSSAAAYAQILLEFAAQPRNSLFSGLVAGPLTGVPMARTSNLSRRIERILNPYRFRLTDLGSRSHVALAAALVPVALVAVVAGVRIVPAVEAAQQTQNPTPAPLTPATGQVAPTAPDQVTATDDLRSPASAPIPAASAPALPAVPPLPPVEKPGLPQGPFGEISVPAPPLSPAAQAAPAPPVATDSFATGNDFDEEGRDSFAIIRGNGSSTVVIDGHAGKGLEEAKRKYHSNFVWFERDGKSYVITDPAIVAECGALFQEEPGLKARQAELKLKQAKLQAEMENLKPDFEKARIPNPEFQAQMARVQREMVKVQQQIASMHLDKLSADFSKEFSAEKQAEFAKQMAEISSEAAKARLSGPELQEQIAKMQQQIAVLQSDAAKQLSEKIAKQLRDSKQLTDETTRHTTKQLTDAETEAQIRNAEKIQEQAEKRLEEVQDQMGDMEGHFGDIQGQLGEILGEIGERFGRVGEKQGELGERMGALGEEMGKIGEQQGKKAEQASRKVQSLIDQAVKDGKAKPVQ